MKTHPETQDIEALSRWNQVKFAAQCAQRVLPQFAEYNVRSQHHLPALEVAVTMSQARAELGDQELPEFDPGLPVQLSDSYEMQALHTTLRAIKNGLDVEGGMSPLPSSLLLGICF